MEAWNHLGVMDIFVAVTVLLFVMSLALALLMVIFTPLVAPLAVFIGFTLAVLLWAFQLFRVIARGMLTLFRHFRPQSPSQAH